MYIIMVNDHGYAHVNPVYMYLNNKVRIMEKYKNRNMYQWKK